MAKYDVFSIEANKKSSITLSDRVFGIEPHQQALFDVVNAQRAAMRQGTHDVKNRGEISGGGRKPWRQKGTGRARQGSIRSPQWRGGGVVFGPTPRKYNVKLNQKVRQLALKSALSYHAVNNSLIIVDSLTIESAKTKLFAQLLKGLGIEGKVLVVDMNLSENIVLAARNIPTVNLTEANHSSVYDILNCKKLLVTKEAIKYFEEVLGND
ncbi:50S ribosomal protein L4 [Acholeplasma sp. OttesenSCG-928-E16]|nr:50S ribosomal protein L4 [Acholeplasma sp. OttesenSCG-928-E16]